MPTTGCFCRRGMVGTGTGMETDTVQPTLY